MQGEQITDAVFGDVFFLTDIKPPVSLGLVTFVFNIPLPKGKSLLKDEKKKKKL